MDDKAKSDLQLDDIQVKKAGCPALIDSLVRGMQLAQGDTGGARAMACVLLAAYNSYRFPLDVTELCVLDNDLREDALNILRLRAIGYEPHNFFQDGGKLFEALAVE